MEKDEEEGGGMNLYRVEVTKVIYVLAENKQEAEDDGPDHAEQESGYEEVFATEATDFVAIEKEWKDSIPYGGDRDDQMTIREFFERPLEPQPYVDPPEQQKLWP